VIGSLVNAGAIVLGGAVAWAGWPAIPGLAQRRLQALLALLAMGLGFHLVWQTLHAPAGRVLRQLLLLTLALGLGKLTGQALGVQARLNRLGQFARRRLLGEPTAAAAHRTGDLLAATVVVFCLTPLAVVGPLIEGLRSDPRALFLKGAVDGLAALGLVRTRGWPVILGAAPVLALQGSLARLAAGVREPLALSGAADAVCATSGFLLVAVALVMLSVLRLRLADYLPALGWAAVLGWAWG